MVEMIVTKHYNCNSLKNVNSSITISLFINLTAHVKTISSRLLMSVNKQTGLLWIDRWIAKINARNRNFRAIGHFYEVPCNLQSPLKMDREELFNK